jgi:hypothetical protein
MTSKTIQRDGPLTRLRRANETAAQAALDAAVAADAALLRDSLRRFNVDGHEYTLIQMRDANADDADMLAWLEGAEVGDRFPAFVECTRTA